MTLEIAKESRLERLRKDISDKPPKKTRKKWNLVEHDDDMELVTVKNVKKRKVFLNVICFGFG